MKHVRVYKEYLTNQRGTYERYEGTYDSKVECEYRKTLFVTGIPTSGRVPDLIGQIENDVKSDGLRDAQNAVNN